MMHKMLVVDDEYMILEGMKHLLPYHEYNVEIVYTAENAEEALDYFSQHTVDLVLTDVSMPDMTGLEMVRRMKEQSPDTHIIIMSVFQEFEYARKAISLGAMDYLLKPINKQELAKLLQQLPTLKKETDREYTKGFLAGTLTASELLRHSQKTWFAARETPNPMGYCREKNILHQVYYFQLTESRPEGSLYTEEVTPTMTIRQLIDKVERRLFYKQLSEDLTATTTELYKDMEPLLRAGRLAKIVDVLPHLADKLREATPAVYLTKQFFNQMMSDVFYYFNEEDHQRLEDFYVKVEASRDLHQLLDYFSHYLKKFSESSTYSPHVQEVVTIVRERFAEELSLKDMSAHLYLNTVYLGQLIKKETGHTFAELLNHQRIKVAQQLLLNSQLGIEEICFQVGYTNVGYFYKIFKRICGESPKNYRQKIGQLQTE
ncbi:TPA: response regulator transcription factor [Streptococcus suis]|nr:response regulator transcription factor [Streptococcus suis]